MNPKVIPHQVLIKILTLRHETRDQCFCFHVSTHSLVRRLVTSVYEAANIQSILTCRDKRMDNTPTWFMFVTAAVQLLMVVNASFNLPIYLFAGQHFRDTLCDMLGIR